MGVAFLALSLLCARPAQAQTSGSWVFDHLVCQGDDIGSGGRDMGTSWEFPWMFNVPTNPYCSAPGNTTPIFDSYGAVDSSSINVTITPFFRWVPGGDPSAPPTILRAKITSAAYAGDENGGSVSADNGFGDVSYPDYLPGGYVFYSDSDAASVGTHLEQKDPQGQTLVSLPPQTLSASGGKANDFQSISSQVDYQADTDDRAVTITSDIDPTYHKGSDPSGNPIRVANSPDAYGSVYADSVNLVSWTDNNYQTQLRGPLISYIPHPTGPWDPDSSYHWYSAVAGTSDSGTFAPATFPVGEAELVSSQEHINLHCIDPSDGASVTANYYVNWHDELEDWITIVDIRQNGVKVRITPIYHPISEGKMSIETENKITVSQKATGEGSLDGDAVGAKFGVELGVDYENSTKLSTEYTFVVGQANWVERQPFWQHREGTVDNYDTHGYVGLLKWTLDSAYHPGNPLIDFDEYPRAEASDPSY